MEDKKVTENGNTEAVNEATGEAIGKVGYNPERRELTVNTPAGTFIAQVESGCGHNALYLSFIPEGSDNIIDIAGIQDTPSKGGPKDVRIRFFGDITSEEATHESIISRDAICRACQIEDTADDTAEIIRGEIESGKRRIGSIHICPKCGGMDFIAYAHVLQTWHVDSRGRLLDTISDCEDVAISPNEMNTWICFNCGNEVADFHALRVSELEAERMLRSALGSQDAEIKADGRYCWATSGGLRLHSDEVCGELLGQLGLNDTFKPHGLLKEEDGLCLVFENR